MSQLEKNNSRLVSLGLSGGGTFAIGWESGFIKGCEDNGMDFKGVPKLGTSGGSFVAGFIEAGVEFEDVASMKQVKLFNRDAGYLYSYANEIFQDEKSEHVSVMVAKPPTWKRPLPEVEELWGGEHTLANMASASSAVPFVFAPHRINGQPYIDGGASLSLASAHRLPRAEYNLTLLAFGATTLPPVGRALESLTRREQLIWKVRHGGGKTILVRPNTHIADLVKRPKDIFSFKIGKEAYKRGRDQAAELLEREEGWEDLADLRDRMKPRLGRQALIADI
jgi:hypothetical protein